ncbi:hypothetical protein F5X96DRAFT_688757 [Biscogniauxia mediterranea]|nr:hypothetical protein F5X96DRAFT_688757 [Biscogniauxia mediterranea]
MATSTKRLASAFVARARKIYRPIGFSKGYNFVLWFVFTGGFFGFILGRLECLRHLGQVLCNGHLVILLSILGIADAIMIARNAVGGGLDVQTVVGLLAIMFIGALAMAMFNIKRLQIEQHRAWMLRAWFYLWTVSSVGGYYLAQPCDRINFALGGGQATLAAYPGCAPFFSGEAPDHHVVVLANYNREDPMQIAAAFNTVFGISEWIIIALHTICIGVYLRLTPAEHERLRNVSYQRQLEVGMKTPWSSWVDY